MELFGKGFWRIAAALAAMAFAATAKLYADTRVELAAARETAKANAAAVMEMKASAAIADDAAVKLVRSARDAASANYTAQKKANEAKNDETYRPWAARPVPDIAWRLLNEAAPNTNSADTAASRAPGAVPGNAGAGTRQ